MPNEEKNIIVKHDIENADANSMRRYYKSLGEACQLLIGQIENLKKEIALAVSLKDQADQNVMQQKEIVTNSLIQSRVKEIELSNEIIELKKQLKILKAS